MLSWQVSQLPYWALHTTYDVEDGRRRRRFTGVIMSQNICICRFIFFTFFLSEQTPSFCVLPSLRFSLIPNGYAPLMLCLVMADFYPPTLSTGIYPSWRCFYSKKMTLNQPSHRSFIQSFMALPQLCHRLLN